MKTQRETDYQRIAEAIKYISLNYKSQPGLNDIAAKVNLSPFHFQRLFKNWAGVSPKQFLQYITITHAKQMLKDHANTLFETALETGLSGTGRLHDLFVKIERMTPGEYKNGGKNLSISYHFANTAFGEIIIASTIKGICYIAFSEERNQAIAALNKQFPQAEYRETLLNTHHQVLHIFQANWDKPGLIKLHLKGTEFQIKVWETLLKIPMGKLCAYGHIAKHIESPGASRAVGSAIGDNPIAFLIPCHRVIQVSGDIGQYHWGSERKSAIIGWEAALTNLAPGAKV